MKFSVIATFTGNIEDRGYDLTLNDVIRVLDDLDIPYDLTEPGDSDYSYLKNESTDDWFAKLQDLQMCAFLTRKEFKEFVSDLGAIAEDRLTFGFVPDIPMLIESNQLISSIRVTPCPEIENEPIKIEKQEQWDKLRTAFISAYS